MNRAVTAARRNVPITLALAFFAVLGVAGLISNVAGVGKGDGGASSTDNAPLYSVAVTGRMAAVEVVGVPVVARITVTNNGDAISHLVLDLSGCSDHWVVDAVTADGASVSRAHTGEYYDTGFLGPVDATHITVTLAPKDAGNHRCDYALYPSVNSDGSPDGDVLDSLATDVAINP